MLPTWLSVNPSAPFPPPERAMPDGLLAIGGDLSCQRLYRAYREGIFPWYNDDADPIMWWSPDPRWVLLPNEFHISRSFRRFLRHCPWQLSLDRNFAAVTAGCAQPREPGAETWITPAMQAAYLGLHEAGLAHSLEVWDGDRLVGGVYGVAVGKIFCAESMFSTTTNGSKVALLGLAQTFSRLGGVLIDCQLHNPHIESLGVRPCHRADYLAILRQLRDSPDLWAKVGLLPSAADLIV